MYFDIPEQFHPCARCSTINSNRRDLCSHCGHVLHARSIRIRGAIVLVLGVLISGGMTYLIVLIADIMRHSDDPGATTRFTGSETAAVGIFGILGLVLVFGIVGIVVGGWMLRYGWRHPKLMRAVLIVGGILWLIGILFQLFT